MTIRERVAKSLRWVADYLDGGDYYCEHWSIGWENGQQVAKWTDQLPQPGVTWGMPLYSRKDEQQHEAADDTTTEAWRQWRDWMSER